MPIELEDYINLQRKKNIPDNTIKKALLQAGYQENQIIPFFNDTPEPINTENISENQQKTKDSIFSSCIDKVVKLELSFPKVILIFLVSVFLFALPVFLYYSYVGDILSSTLGVLGEQYQGFGSPSSFTDMADFLEPNLGFFIVVLITILLIRIIEILYLYFVKYFFLKETRFIDIFRSYSIYSFFPSIFLFISLIYNFAIIKIVNGWSIIALVFFPLIGFIFQYVFVAESLFKFGNSRLKSYMILIIQWLLLLVVLLVQILCMTSLPWDLLLRYAKYE